MKRTMTRALALAAACVLLLGQLSAFAAKYAVGGDYPLALNGLMITDRPVRVVVDPPEGAYRYNYRLIIDEIRMDYTDTYPYPDPEFWVNMRDYNPRHVDRQFNCTLEVYVLDDSMELMGIATAHFRTYPESEVMILPEDLVVIGDRAFEGTTAGHIDMQYEVESIGSRAFANCPNLTSMRIATSVKSIAADAFQGCPDDLVIEATLGSAGARFAAAHGYTLLPVAE